MATDEQIIANRQNARQSTGPRTESGKRRLRRNAIRRKCEIYRKTGTSVTFQTPVAAELLQPVVTQCFIMPTLGLSNDGNTPAQGLTAFSPRPPIPAHPLPVATHRGNDLSPEYAAPYQPPGGPDAPRPISDRQGSGLQNRPPVPDATANA